MSYDLFLTSTSRDLSADAFNAFFDGRPRYNMHGDDAVYENDDTGVYFLFQYSAEERSVAFNLNYFRPHFFGLEAAPEVEAFVQAFDCAIQDPQNEGMGDGPFSVDGFLRGWNAGNRFGYRAMLSRDQPELQVYPTAELERVWRWNLAREAVQETVLDSHFVPKQMFMKGVDATRARTFIVWPDGCPIFMPRTDLIVLLREAFSSDPTAEDPRELTLVNWSEVEPIVSAFPFDSDRGCYRLDYAHPPSEVADFVRSRPIKPHDPSLGLAYDQVLNEELVASLSDDSRAS